MMNSQPHRQFSLRELLALVLIVALAIGWWLDHRRLSDAVDDARAGRLLTDKVAAYKDAEAWRLRAGTLEQLVAQFGLRITWMDNYSWLRVEDLGANTQSPTKAFEPSESIDTQHFLKRQETQP